MKKKSKIIIASCILAVIISALVVTIVICRPQSNTETADETAQVWKEKPFDYSEIITKYSSYQEPFRIAVSDLREKLEEASEENECELNIVSAYMTEKDTPTLIIAYDNPEGGNNVMICKYADNMLYKAFILGGDEKLGDGCELLIVQECNVIAFRSGLYKSSGTQSIYNFDGNKKYSADRTESFDADGISDNMDKMLAEYLGNDITALTYSELAITENADDAIDNFIKDKE